MTITHISFRIGKQKKGAEYTVLYYCSLVLDKWLYLNNIRIVRGKSGVHIELPYVITATGKRAKYYRILGEENSKQFENAILDEWNHYIEEGEAVIG